MKQLVVLIFLFNTAYGQIIKVPLHDKFDGDSTFKYLKGGKILDDVSIYKGINSVKLEKWAVQSISFNSVQSIAEEVIKKRLTKEAFMDWAKMYKCDSSTYTFERIIERNNFAILVGFDRLGNKHIVVDANNNKDFEDDKEYIFDPASKNPSIFKVTVDIDYLNGKNLKSVKIPYVFDALKSNIIDSIERKLYVGVTLKYSKLGSATINDEKITFQLGNDELFLYKNARFNLIKLPPTVAESYWYSSKALLDIGRSLYTIDSVNNDTLYLTYKEKILHDSGRLNTQAINFSDTDLINQKPIKLKQKRGDYVLLDFWGSWCNPCIAALPRLNTLYNKFSSKGLKVISIAYDKQTNIPLLKKIITEKKLTWNQMFVDRDKTGGVVSDYKVQQFPTSILIDPNGKIVVRGVSEKILEDIESYLSKVYR